MLPRLNSTAISFISCAFVLCISCGVSFSQDIRKEKVLIKPREVADELFAKGKYYEAVVYYEQALQDAKNKNEIQLNYNLAECYRMCRQYAKAEEIYQLVTDRGQVKYPLSLFWLATVQKAEEKYRDASENFKEYSVNKKNDKVYIEEAQREIPLCELAIKAKLDMAPTVVELMDPEINTDLTADRATVIHDTLWYISTVKSDIKDKIDLDDVKGTYKDFYVARLFFAVYGKNGKWEKGTEAKIPLEDKRSDIISPFFDPESGNLFFTKRMNGNCEIYRCKYEKGMFSDPVKLESPVNIGNSSSKDPMLVFIKNTKYLFFVSDRDKNTGFDIFFCTIDKNGKISNAQKLGSEINTRYDEHSPFYDPTLETLYFSSRGYNTVGEYDIFSVNGNPVTGWGNPANMGFPVNSGADDYYYYHYSTGNNYHAFFSSNRPTKEDELYGTVCDNLFQFNFSAGKAIAVPPQWVTLKCKIFDESNKFPLTGDTVRLYQKSTDKLMDIQYSRNTNIVSFKLKRDSAYSVEVLKKDYYSTIVKINATSPDTTFTKEIFLNKIVKPEPVITQQEVKPKEELKIEPKVEPKVEPKPEPKKIERVQLIQPKDFKFPVIYFDFGKSELTNSEKGKLNGLAEELMKRTELVIYVESYTDNVDSKNFNIVLSQKRSKSVIDYLADRGVEESRLIGQWFGEDKPASHNETDQSRALNRRTEFAIINDMTNIRRGQMTSGDETENEIATASKKEYGTDIDEDVFKELLQKQGRKCMSGLYYRVQIGAYRDADANMAAKMSQFAYLQSKIDVMLSVEADGDLKKYVTSRFATLNEANEYKVLIRKTNIKDAFIVPYYRGNRIKMSELVFLFLE